MEFITPIVKLTKGKCKTEKVKRFYSIPTLHTWLKDHEQGKGWNLKYYKGLGTSTANDAIEYFRDIEHHKLIFEYTGKKCDKAIELAFKKGPGAADARKKWLSAFLEGTYLDQTKGTLTYAEFIHEELILFSLYSVKRAIPSMVDGLKPVQRKILFTAFKMKIVNEIKVAQLQVR